MLRPPPITDGVVLARRYRIVRRLGAGGTSEVFEAEHTWTGQRVAIKVLASGTALAANVAARFVREARSAAHLVHPNIVRVMDVDRDPDRGDLFIVQELLAGGDLEAYREARGRVPYREALG